MYDLVIIGAGAAGIEAAKYSIKKKLKAALIDKNIESFGGVCLNKGCIPTKFFLNFGKEKKDLNLLSSLLKDVIKKIKEPTIDYLKKNNVDIIFGEASFLDKNKIKVKDNIIEARNIIIATGSIPKKINEKYIFSEELFSNLNLKENILIVGAGYIGLEFASLLNTFGKKVLVIEKENEILPKINSKLKNRLKIILERKGIEIKTSMSFENLDLSKFDSVIFSTGRLPNLNGLNLESIGIELDSGWIKTDKYLKTNIDNIFACGDVVNKKFFAYVAQYQARICVENIISKKTKEDYSFVPECVFSIPAFATVGFTEETAKENNIKYNIIKSNFLRFSSSYVYNDLDGFIEILTDSKDKIIGAQIISKYAFELINIFSIAIKNSLKLKDLNKSFLVHPTISEIVNLD